MAAKNKKVAKQNASDHASVADAFATVARHQTPDAFAMACIMAGTVATAWMADPAYHWVSYVFGFVCLVAYYGTACMRMSHERYLSRREFDDKART